MNPATAQPVTVKAYRTRLLPHKAQEYRHMHDHIPSVIVRNLLIAGANVLHIFQNGLELTMIVTVDEGAAADGRPDLEAEQRWQEAASACFEHPWEEIDLIFNLHDHLARDKG